ncbi:MAG TPA: hypothetical protein VGR69_02155, partial [Candidatus Rubrimentiphilum sp.]|nr:hypothetical protein [Candidatus Rubrimentiphilum sp.]
MTGLAPAQVHTPRPGAAEALLHALSGAKSLAKILGRLQAAGGGQAFSLHETIAVARPALLAALYRALGGQVFVVVPTADAAERSFADLLYYLQEDEATSVALLRSRDETIGALESPSERSARMALLNDLHSGK